METNENQSNPDASQQENITNPETPKVEELQAKIDELKTAYENQKKRAELAESKPKETGNMDNIVEEVRALKEKQAQQEFDTKFDMLFETKLAESPEYREIANKAVIKTLYKTTEKDLSDILKETYGNVKIATQGFEDSATKKPVADAKKMTLEDLHNLKEVDKKAYKDSLIKRTSRFIS
jgi:hypothetical protein